MVSGSPPLFAQTHHRADSAAYPWKEEASGMEPPEFRQTYHPAAAAHNAATTFPFAFPFFPLTLLSKHHLSEAKP